MTELSVSPRGPTRMLERSRESTRLINAGGIGRERPRPASSSGSPKMGNCDRTRLDASSQSPVLESSARKATSRSMKFIFRITRRSHSGFPSHHRRSSSVTSEHPTLSLHLRSAKTFTPGASALLAEILGEMQSKLRASIRD